MRKPPTDDRTTLRGRIDNVYYSSPRFSAGSIKTDQGRQASFVGPFLAKANEQVVLRGRWTDHQYYGRQLQVEELEYNLEFDADGLVNYLSKHPDFKGIGPAKARKIVERFGDNFDQALDEKPEEIAKATGVPLPTIHLVRDEWKRNRAFNTVSVWLSAFGLTHHQVTTLIKRLGGNAVGILKENPYLLIQEVAGFGFRRVDQIALRMGTSKEKPERIRAGILYCVDEAIKQGDCYVDHEDLRYRANTLLVMDVLDSEERIDREISFLIEAGDLDSSSHFSRLLIARPKMLRMERDLFEWFVQSRSLDAQSDPVTIVDHLIQGQRPPLNENQQAAVSMVFNNTISVISGGAGVGKTFTVATISRICDQLGLEIVLCAPTGKAAKRLEQVVGRPASTIHRLLGYNGEQFQRGPSDPIPADLVVIDETSMVDVSLAWHLFQAIDLKRTSVVLIGDHNQLPPVGPGYILRDLARSDVVPKVILDTVVRQAGVLKDNCTAVLKGEVRKTSDRTKPGPKPWIVVPEFSDPQDIQRFLLDMFNEIIPERLGFDLLKEVQVLTPTHKGPLGTRELNIGIQRLLQKKLWDFDVPPVRPNRKPRIYLHDKVIQTRNNYDIDVMNGTMGIVTKVGRGSVLTIDFEGRLVTIDSGEYLRDLELAYVLTTHRAQGSEFPCSVVIVHKSHSFMHHRNLLYTGVTRAKQTAIILGDGWGIRNCAQKQQVNKRNTFLSQFLEEAADGASSVPRRAPPEENAQLVLS